MGQRKEPEQLVFDFVSDSKLPTHSSDQARRSELQAVCLILGTLVSFLVAGALMLWTFP